MSRGSVLLAKNDNYKNWAVYTVRERSMNAAEDDELYLKRGLEWATRLPETKPWPDYGVGHHATNRAGATPFSGAVCSQYMWNNTWHQKSAMPDSK
jgi:hypothetical protein